MSSLKRYAWIVAHALAVAIWSGAAWNAPSLIYTFACFVMAFECAKHLVKEIG